MRPTLEKFWLKTEASTALPLLLRELSTTFSQVRLATAALQQWRYFIVVDLAAEDRHGCVK